MWRGWTVFYAVIAVISVVAQFTAGLTAARVAAVCAIAVLFAELENVRAELRDRAGRGASW